MWNNYIYFSIIAIVCWSVGAFFAWKGQRKWGLGLTSLGLLVFFSFIVMMWVTLERPPLRTMGETRLWYAFFLPLCGTLVYLRWGYRWILALATIIAAVFVCINLFKPEIHDKTLMPALQSPWFAPHVIVYIFAYALLGAATLMAIYNLLIRQKEQQKAQMLSDTADLVRIGWGFLTIGMLFGALWAKEAWGHYWSWDPKETWAAVTWLAYLVYIHHRPSESQKNKVLSLSWLILCFVLLQMCWWGINLLPSAQATSVHTYTS